MKLKFNILSIATAAVLGAGLSSCNDWLKVDMEDQVMENTLFSQYKGFRTALNGVYISMLDQYTNNFSTANLDVMAQCYNVSTLNDHSRLNWALLRYANLEDENNKIWNNFYNLIANVNIIIEHTQEDNPLTASQYGIIRGEALALRAMFHFDLLRLYGPVFSISDQLECMPYQASSRREILPFLKACDVLDLIIKDLDEAAKLLKDADPIITDGVRLTTIVDNGVNNYDTFFRQFRLNYYAVQALRARAYLWKGDKTEAYRIATKDIIEAIAEIDVFPWTTKEAATANGKPDLIFSSEVMFSLYHSQRDTRFNTPYFSESNEPKTILTFYGQDLTSGSKVSFLYDSGDLRRDQWATSDNEGENATSEQFLVLKKFAPLTGNTDGSEYFRYMIPLIRLSEVYIMAAECAPTESEGRDLINTLRLQRNCPDLTPEADFTDALLKEMYLETLGEGQMFFYYKRHASTSVISGIEPNGVTEIPIERYVMPTPPDELAQRTTNGK